MRVLMVLLDTLRYDAMGFNPGGWARTPNLDRLARRSVVFDRAYLGSYPCMPARRDLFTGRFEFCERGWGPLEPADASLPALVSEQHGITSMLVTDHYHLWEKGSGNYHFDFSGYEFVRGQEYDKWRVEPLGPGSRGPSALEAGHLEAGLFEQNQRNVAHRRDERDFFPAQVFGAAASWVERNREREDWLLFVDCFDPHEPFDPPAHYRAVYDAGYTGPPVEWATYGWSGLSPEQIRQLRALYAAELTMVDRWFGELVFKLEQLGQLEETMIVVTTDHGFMLGEHDTIGKPWAALSDSNLYEEISHVPLLIHHPALVEPGRRVGDLVQPVDLFPTVLEAFGIAAPAGVHGRSLFPYLTADVSAPPPEVACYGRFGESLNVTDGEWTLFLWPPGERNEPLLWHSPTPPQFGPYEVAGPPADGAWPVTCARGAMSTQLFHTRDDPGQQRDLARQHPEHVARLRHAARAFLERVGAPQDQYERLGVTEPP